MPGIATLPFRERDTAAGAAPAFVDSDDVPLARILSGAEFGLRVTSPEGRLVFDNGVHIDAPDSERKIGVRRSSVALDDVCYEIALVLDETVQHLREQDLIQRAFFDELTRLPNRALLERTVGARIAEYPAEPFALAFIDLDGFKLVNDYYGHDVGDELLSRLAQRLEACLRQTDVLARLSGDEFALLLSPIGNIDDLHRDVEWLSERIKEPVFIDGHEIMPSASIGVSLYPRDGASIVALRANADRAMYRAKSRTKGSVQFYDDGIEHASAARSRAEQRLRRAIRDHRVCCAYQPKVEIRTGRITGVEALMRWRDEDGLIQAPGDFVALAVELGLIDDLTHFILAETIRSLDLVNEAFGPDCTISFNVAARQAGDPRFMRSLVSALADSGSPGRFMVELTEDAFIAKSAFQERILPMIREVGARVSIDDFGTGYSSLAALADITADEVKVDRSFVPQVHQRPRSQAVLKAIEALAQSLGMSIVVEGVESFEEVAYLQAATRIQFAQGYYFSKPILLDEPAATNGLATRSASPARQPTASRMQGG